MANIQKWASGWNSPRLPGRVFGSKKLLLAAIDQDDETYETEIKPLMDNGLVEESDDFEAGKYRVLGIPDEFGEWYLWYEEEDDGRGGTIGTWSIVQESDDEQGNLWEAKYDAQDAYDWTMKNYKNPGKPTEPKEPQETLESVQERMWDLTHKPTGMTPQDKAELEKLKKKHLELHPEKRELPRWAARTR